MWCLLKASHQSEWFPIKTGRGETVVSVQPGQFIFGRKTAAKELKMSPSTVQDRIKKLAKHGNLVTQTFIHYSIISIINWDSYQTTEKDNDTKSVNHPSTNRHIQECKEVNTGKISDEISSLRSRYPNQQLVDRVFDAIRSTRKSGRVADSVLLAQLRKWERYSVEQVEPGIKTYLRKDFAGDGRGEAYLLGIIRNQKTQPELPSWWDRLPQL